MAAITVHQQVFEILKKAYKEKFGESPKLLITEINRVYQDKTDNPTSVDVISDKTIRNFFKNAEPSKMQEKNLNFLCRVLLGYESYQQALRQETISEPIELTNSDTNGEWRKHYYEYLKIKCGTMKVLNMNKPLQLDNIYANVNVLENIRKKEQKKQKNIEEVLSNLSKENVYFQKLKDRIITDNITAIDAVKTYKKLLIWGRPGAGKTTFLKYLALHSAQEVGEQLTPVFISLKAFADEEGKLNLTEAIKRELISYISESDQLVYDLLEQGRCLILLDGLDEIVETESERVYKNINSCIEEFPNNHFVMTCRSGYSDYKFAYFTEVEIADFDDKQILIFVNKWFASCQESKKLEDRFLTELKKNESIKDLSTNPLLLTMLCLVFEDNNEFPKTQYSLTEESVNIFLRKWDANRRIERNKIHNFDFTYHRKVHLLSKIAYDGFNQDPQKFFWRQSELEGLINNYIENILEIDPDTLALDSLAVLKTLEANHGLLVKQAKDIYSFAHLTFQEYFVANYIVESRESKTLENFIKERLTEPQWREIFLIVAGRLSHADNFFKIIFSQINKLVESRELQEMLTWLYDVTSIHDVKSSSWRAFYLFINHELPLFGNLSTERNYSFNLTEHLAVLLRELNLQRGQKKERSQLSNFALNLVDTFSKVDARANGKKFEPQNINPLLREHLLISGDAFIIPELQSVLNIDKDVITINKQGEKITLDKEHLSEEYMNTIAKNFKSFEDLVDGLIFLRESFPADNAPTSDWKQWINQLQGWMILYLHIAYDDVKFSPEQIKILEDYIYANILLIECIKAGSYSSKDLRNQIIDHLLLPDGRIPKHLTVELHIA